MNITLPKKVQHKVDEKIEKLFINNNLSKNKNPYGGLSSYFNNTGKGKLIKLEEMFWSGFDGQEHISFKSFSDIFRESLLLYINNDQYPYFEELKNDFLRALYDEIDQRSYVFKVFGVDFEDDPPNDFPFMKADEDLLNKIEYEDDGFLKIGDPVLIVSSFGDREISLKKSVDKANLILAVLSVLVCSNFKDAGRKFKMSIVSPSTNPEIGVIYGWDKKGASWSKKFTNPPLKIGKKIYSIYEEGYRQLVKDIESDNESEVFRLITTSLLWFFEAQKDFATHFSFIKYWTSIEIFFSLKESEDNKITEKNKKGVSCLVKASGVFEEEIEKLISKIGKLYDKRSKALHDGNYKDIEKEDVDSISIYAAMSILGVVFLYNEGKIKSRRDIFLLMNKYHENQ